MMLNCGCPTRSRYDTNKRGCFPGREYSLLTEQSCSNAAGIVP